MILILTAPDDLHADVVGRHLRGRRPVLRFDPAQFPKITSLTVAFAGGSWSATVDDDIDPVDLRSTTVVWNRRPGRPLPDPGLPEEAKVDVADQSLAFTEDLWALLGATWLPGPPRGGLGKLVQLRLAAELGFSIPDTLVSTDPGAFARFYRSHDGAVVSKLIGGSRLNSEGSGFVRYTERVEPWEVTGMAAVSHCPVIFQHYVPKALELRVTVVGDQVFPAEILSQVSRHTRTDWRRYDHRTTPVRPHTFPVEMSARCAALTLRLGLLFATIDLVLTPAGEYVFLELNANGQYLWIEELTSLPISAAVADLLVTLDEQG